jgi:hypothetical protein
VVIKVLTKSVVSGASFSFNIVERFLLIVINVEKVVRHLGQDGGARG